MFRKICILFLICAGSSVAQVKVPDTPAGRTLQTWLDAFNSGDRAKVEAYIKTVDPSQSADQMMAFHNETGGFDLLSIEDSQPLHILFRFKEKSGTTNGAGNLVVKDGQPPTVVRLSLRPLPKGAVLENVTVDAAERTKVIAGVTSAINEYYVDPALAQKMSDTIKANAAKGDYNAITDGDTLAERLTADMRAVSYDRHLRVDFSPFKVPPEADKLSPEDEAEYHHEMERINCAFDRVEILPNNIGYIKFDAFMDPSFCGPTVTAAMAFIAHTDAVIFDIRENHGGDPAMVSLIASYLFDQPTHLIDIYNRKENTTKQNWTLSYLPGTRLAKQPVFVLTSKETFSGGEEFAFDLKTQKRATIIGETTGGGAHPVSPHTVADYFTVGVPFAKSLAPVTGKNWEGTGVEPDVKVPAADALTTAKKLAAEKLKTTK